MKIMDTFKAVWTEMETVVELFIYLFIAAAISKLFGLSYLQSVALVFVYFIMNIVRTLVEIYRNKT